MISNIWWIRAYQWTVIRAKTPRHGGSGEVFKPAVYRADISGGA
jgi:hypothetical protein